MPCYHPMVSYSYVNSTGQKTVRPIKRELIEQNAYYDIDKYIFNELSRTHKASDLQQFKVFNLPCGQCLGCRLERSRQWAMRCVMEASLHEKNCFVTLTYDDEHLDPNGSLEKRDFPLFMKRLRKKYGEGIRFFHCGEYGEIGQRPHHHAILFGVDFERELWREEKHTQNFVALDASLMSSYSYSSQLSSLWPFGFSSIGSVTFESAAYVARYCLKKINGQGAEEHYQGRLPEYVTMSRRPGIAAGWFAKYNKEVYPADKCLARGYLCKPPRYFDKLFEREFPEDFEKLKKRREVIAEHLGDLSKERLTTLEESATLRLRNRTL